MPALRASLQTVSSQRDLKGRVRPGGAVTPLPALPPPPPPNHSSLSFLSAHSLSSSVGLSFFIVSFSFFPLLIQRRSPSLSLSQSLSFSIFLSQPPPSIPTLELLAGLSKISIPSNAGLPVTSYFIQLEGIKAIKSKRSRQAPVKLSPHGPHPFSAFSLFLSAKAAPVFHPNLACFQSCWLSFLHPLLGQKKPAIDASNLTKLGWGGGCRWDLMGWT